MVQIRKANEARVVNLYAFSSSKKMASVLVDRGDGTLRLYNKGASEWVLAVSTALVNEDGSKSAMTEGKRAELMEIVTEMATRGLRTLVRLEPLLTPLLVPRACKYCWCVLHCNCH